MAQFKKALAASVLSAGIALPWKRLRQAFIASAVAAGGAAPYLIPGYGEGQVDCFANVMDLKSPPSSKSLGATLSSAFLLCAFMAPNVLGAGLLGGLTASVTGSSRRQPEQAP